MRSFWVGVVLCLSTLVGMSQTVRNFPALETSNIFMESNQLPWINNTLYAGTVLFPSVQTAVTAACAIATPMNVIVTVGTNSGVNIPTVTGCTTASIVDQRALPFQYCTYTTVYACTSGGGGGGGSPPAAPAQAIQIANTDVTGPAADRFFTIDPVAHVMTARNVNGLVNTDSYGGVAGYQSNADCTTAQCSGVIPPSSVDTISILPLATTSSKGSSFVNDRRGNADARFGTNPAPSQIPQTLQWQTLLNDSVLYTKPNTSPQMGAEQLLLNQTFVTTAPCFSNGIGSENPLFQPPAGYTSVAAWCNYATTNLNTIMYGAGIHQNGGGTFYVEAGDGDVQGAYWYLKYAGGYRKLSDEGFKWLGGNMSTIDDGAGVFATVVDTSHFFLTYSNNSVGQDRLLVDTSIPFASNTFLDSVTSPSNDGLTPGTAVLNEVTFVKSTGRAHFAVSCPIPVQTNGVVQVSCPVVVDDGAFDTMSARGVASEAAPQGDLENLGINITAVTALSGGAQTLTMYIHKSIPAGAFMCQGGMASTAIELLADSQDTATDGAPVSGQVVPVFCSTDTHTLWYASPNSSQIWSTLIPPNSQQRTTAITTQGVGGGAYTVNLSRASGVTTGVITAGATTGLNLLLDGNRFFTIKGCSVSNFNVTFNGAQVYLNGVLDPTGQTFQYADSNADSAGCTGATFIPQHTTVSVFPAAEIYDVQNPSTGLVDGTVITSVQPAFAGGHAFKVPTNEAANVDGIFLLQDMAQPSFGHNGFHVQLNSNSALGSTAFLGTIIPITDQIIGAGGNVPAGTLVRGQGQFHFGLYLDTAPDPLGAVIDVEFSSGLCTGFASGASCPLWKNYNILRLAGGTVLYNFNELKATFTTTMGGVVELQTPTQTTFNNATVLQNAQFGGFYFSGTNQQTALSQLRPLAAVGSLGTEMSYDNVVGTPAVTVHGTPGSTRYIYSISVHYPHGDSFSTPAQIFNGAATLNGTNNNVISCSIIPAGLTGIVWMGTNPLYSEVGTCPNNTSTVTDTGTYTTVISWNSDSAAGDLFLGATIANAYLFRPLGFNQYSAASAQFTQTSNGVLSLDTGTAGNGQGELDALVFKMAGSLVCTLATGCGATTGSATLAAGTVTVTTAAAVVVAGTHIYGLTNCGVGGTVGTLSVGTIIAGTSFIINSSSVTDTSKVCWSVR